VTLLRTASGSESETAQSKFKREWADESGSSKHSGSVFTYVLMSIPINIVIGIGIENLSRKRVMARAMFGV
jgi:hypothetical protein